MTALVIEFPPARSASLREAAVVQKVAAKIGLYLSLGEAIEVCRDSQNAELSEEGRAVARDIAGSLGIKLKPERV